jgi:5-methyltetrahydrofolate--homocysteine methyltransferase
MLDKIKDAIVNFDEEGVAKLISEAVNKKVPTGEILGSISAALDEVGKKYDSHEYFLAELMMCGETAKKAIALVRPLVEADRTKRSGKIIFGTVKGDIHDIGKTIVGSFLIGAGFDVHDMGVEVTAETLVSKTKELKPDIIAMSALLSNTAPYMETVIDALKKAGLRGKVKVIVGGRPVSKDFATKIGADGTAVNPSDAVAMCKGWIK